jgi:hypothetical protein
MDKENVCVCVRECVQENSVTSSMVNSGNIMLSGINQAQKDKCCLISLTHGI